jgi:uncharacterized protein involved in oxidation of intracellular sulfur
MKYLFILNDPPYGTERSYNGLRLASALAKVTPNGYYNIERMLKLLASKGGTIGVCGSCMDARGLKAETLAQGTRRSSMDELAVWTQEADRVMVF